MVFAQLLTRFMLFKRRLFPQLFLSLSHFMTHQLLFPFSFQPFYTPGSSLLSSSKECQVVLWSWATRGFWGSQESSHICTSADSLPEWPPTFSDLRCFILWCWNRTCSCPGRWCYPAHCLHFTNSVTRREKVFSSGQRESGNNNSCDQVQTILTGPHNFWSHTLNPSLFFFQGHPSPGFY